MYLNMSFNSALGGVVPASLSTAGLFDMQARRTGYNQTIEGCMWEHCIVHKPSSNCLTVITPCVFTRSGISFLHKSHCIFPADPSVGSLGPLHFEGMRTSMIHILWINTLTHGYYCALPHILTSSPQDGQAPGSGFAFLSTPDVLDMSFCSFTGLVPDFMFPGRSDEQAAVYAQVRLAELGRIARSHADYLRTFAAVHDRFQGLHEKC